MINVHRNLLLFCLLLCGCGTTIEAPVVSPAERQVKQDKSYQERRLSKKRSPPKGVHRVARGETLYSIAWGYGFDYKEVARWNTISPPYTIFPGQILRLSARSPVATKKAPVAGKSKKKVISAAKTSGKAQKTATKRKTGPQPAGRLIWHWPTTGKVVKMDSPTSKKGVTIAGSLGQVIKAAASGDVVYSGSGLLGYGKLIIIKHSDTFLSAYAHNSNILVKEGEKVVLGQKIATMGLGNNGKPVLHFEIRKNGKPVDPLKHLPDKHT